MIDDTVMTPEHAMEAFQKSFPLTRLFVDRERNKMIYTLKNGRLADHWMRSAERIIREMSLPLEANLNEWSRRGVVFEIQIEISYTA